MGLLPYGALNLFLRASSAMELGKYQLITIGLNNRTFVIARCNMMTGEGRYRVGTRWHKAVEENPVEKSNYICAAHAFGDNGWLFVRMDLNSGRLWTLQGEIWRLVLE